jgi:opacity protein-like surface antigen
VRLSTPNEEVGMRLQRVAVVTLVLAGVTLAVPDARAEGYFTGFGGIVFGGDLASGPAEDLDLDNSHGVYGAAIGGFGTPLGIELEFSYSPNFFGSNRALVPENNLMTLMGNLVLSGHVGEMSRIYASAGGGLMKSNIEDAGDFFDVGSNDFGVNAGVGVLAAVGDNLAIRADFRYFRNLGDDDLDDEFDIDFGSFDFWRATGGLSLRF